MKISEKYTTLNKKEAILSDKDAEIEKKEAENKKIVLSEENYLFGELLENLMASIIRGYKI